MKVLIGICGSIAAYKTLELTRILKREGADIRFVLTKSALNFITPLSCQTLSENEVFVDQFVLTKGIKHIALSQWADMLVVAPATANIIGKAASGIGDDLLSTTMLSFTKPILIVPAMDTGMWQNKIVQRNVRKLKEAGYYFMEPTTGLLASGKIGKGRFPHVSLIHKKIMAVIKGYTSLAGMKFLITGGRTEEDVDPVRVLSNRSSGRMGRELLYAVICRDGQVRGVFGRTGVSLPEGIEVENVRTSAQMLRSLKKQLTWCDCLIMPAAIGDYRPRVKSPKKIHSTKLDIKLQKTKDLLKELSKNKDRCLFVGFSLEERNQVTVGRKKMISKGLDLIILNSPKSINSDRIDAQIMRKSDKIIKVGKISKWELANRILDECIVELRRRKK
jgi:phosphopantothenoylcysteine decarboxylase/phosphopantothenate--cysteine ligase